MSNFFFDGTANVTAAKTDNVVITANPALFVSEAQVGGNVVISYSNGTSITVTGANLADGATALPNVSVVNGTFSTGETAATLTASSQNALIFNPSAGTTVTADAGTSASGVKALFGGLGRADANDTSDSFTIGGKGSFLAYGNAGADVIQQGTTGGNGTNFDSTSFVTVFGGKNDLGSDQILLANGSNAGAKMAIYGGEGVDSINIFNKNVSASVTANTTIFGGQGAADSTDLADTITFNGGGTVNIFANAGDDTVNLGSNKIGTGVNGIDSTTVGVIHGGLGADKITVAVTADAKATLSIFGDENSAGLAGANADSITVTGTGGTTVIYGGTAAADANDNADSISYTGQGTATIYAAGGDDSVFIDTGVGGVATGTLTAQASSSTTVFGGNGNDTIRVFNTSAATGTQTLDGGAGSDSFFFGNTTGTAVGATNSDLGTGRGVTINNFDAAVDRITINDANAGTATVSSVGNADTTLGLQAALNSASGASGTIKTVGFGSDTYIVVNIDGTAGTWSETGDMAIKLTGVTNNAALLAAITPV